MLIYGNTPRDIMKMMWRRKFKLLTVAVLILVAVTLMGCTVGSKKVNPPLMALDKFFETLGSGKNKTKEIKQDSAEVE
jgi:hypothetical protein